MHPELESLVKAYEAVQTASPADAPELFAVYGSKIDDSAARMRIDRAFLDRAVRWQHGLWVRAQSRPPAISRKP
jgi:hypothetical protein